MEEFQVNSRVGQEEGNFGMLYQIMEGMCSVTSVTQSNMLNTRKGYDDICLLCQCNNTNHHTKFIALTLKTGKAPLCDSYMSVKVGLHVRVESLSVAHERRSRTCNHLREPTNRDHGGLAESQLDSTSCVRVN